MQSNEAGFFKNHITTKEDKGHGFLFWVDKVALITIRITAFFWICTFIISVIGIIIAMGTKQSFGESVKPMLPKVIANKI